MISESSSYAKVPARFAQAPWNEHTALGRQLDEQRGTCAYGVCVGRLAPQSARAASILKPETKRGGAVAHHCGVCCIKPDGL